VLRDDAELEQVIDQIIALDSLVEVREPLLARPRRGHRMSEESEQRLRQAIELADEISAVFQGFSTEVVGAALAQITANWAISIEPFARNGVLEAHEQMVRRMIRELEEGPQG
jgi:ethanolamine ammonia-lyase small subunit